MTLIISKATEENLTRAHGALEANIRMSHAGQAHFAGTGPDGKTCRMCEHWKSEGYAASGILKPVRCTKYQQLTGKPGSAVPHSAPVCKYFSENEKPPQAALTT